MGRWAREHRLWLTLAGLAVLLITLALLQYRWIGELGRADAERRRTLIERSAARFAFGLDRELGRAAMTFRLEQAAADPASHSTAVRARIALWRQEEHAALVARVHLASVGDEGKATLQVCTAEDCLPENWPEPLDGLRQKLEQQAERTRGGQPLGFRPALLLDPPETMVVPLFGAAEEAPDPQGRRRFRIRGLVLLDLDVDYLRDELLPQIAEASLGEGADTEFAVTVLRVRDGSVLYTNQPGASAEELHRADLELPAPFGVRSPRGERRGRAVFGEIEQRRADEAGAPAAEPRADRGVEPRSGRDDDPRAGRDRPPRQELAAPWRLLVRHRHGPLGDTVSAMRRRNLAVGLGVLALLGAAAVLLATGAQRSRELARQQLEFVAGVTHELNTPVAAIRSAAQNLADGIVTDAPQVRRYGALIEQEGSRLTSLVAQVLDFAGIQAGARAYASERVSLVDVVDKVLGEMGLALEQSGLAVKRETAPGLPEVMGDAAALRRMLSNLLSNAVKFAASGGLVTVRLLPANGGSTAVMRVEDRGPGIPAGERERVFEPFYRGSAAQSNETPGNGLGLSLVRRVVEAHGGRVRAEQPAGGGMAVVVELPAAPRPAREEGT